MNSTKIFLKFSRRILLVLIIPGITAGACYLGGKNPPTSNRYFKGGGKQFKAVCFRVYVPVPVVVILCSWQYRLAGVPHPTALRHVGCLPAPRSSPCTPAVDQPCGAGTPRAPAAPGFVSPASPKHLHKLQGTNYFSCVRYQVSYGFAG